VVDVLVGDPGVIVMSKNVMIYGNWSDIEPEFYASKSRIIFDEKIRIGQIGGIFERKDKLPIKPILPDYWTIDNVSSMFVKFLQHDNLGRGIDDDGTVHIQALRKEGQATIICVFCTYCDEDIRCYSRNHFRSNYISS
jgi:hypothetical protein